MYYKPFNFIFVPLMMTKKAIHIIISLIFNLALTGVVVHTHYSCMNMDDMAVFHDAQSCCTDGCEQCEDVTEAFRLDTNFLISQALHIVPSVINLPFLIPAFDADLAQTTPASIPSTVNFPSGSLPDISPQALLQIFRC